MFELDLQGLKCPLPALHARKKLETLRHGDVLEVITTDPLAVIDIPDLVRECGHVLKAQQQEGASTRFIIVCVRA
jgi:tRNA 2-thiouridine synthesizing protein A